MYLRFALSLPFRSQTAKSGEHTHTHTHTQQADMKILIPLFFSHPLLSARSLLLLLLLLLAIVIVVLCTRWKLMREKKRIMQRQQQKICKIKVNFQKIYK